MAAADVIDEPTNSEASCYISGEELATGRTCRLSMCECHLFNYESRLKYFVVGSHCTEPLDHAKMDAFPFL